MNLKTPKMENTSPCSDIFFSVIIPTYNRKEFLRKSLGSVLKQTYKNFEVLVVDDGSSDGTQGLVNTFQDRRIKYMWQENKGPSGAKNTGIKNSQGKWLCFLDSDDWWDKRKLEITLEYIKRNPEYKIFHTEEIWYRKGKLLNQKKVHKKYGGWIFDRCLDICRVSISTACIQKSVFEDIGLFDEELPCCEDYDFWLRCSLKYPLYLIPLPLTLKEGGHPDQVSHKFWGMDRFRIKALSKILEDTNIGSLQRILALRELERKIKIYVGGCIKRGKNQEASEYLKLLRRYNSSSRKTVRNGKVA